jgi:hypothetical protein
MNVEEFVKRADALISQADEALKTRSHFNDQHWQQNYVDSAASTAFRAAGLSFLTTVFGTVHPYTTEFARALDGSSRQSVREAQSTLLAARDELAGGWFVKVRSIVSAEIFADFLEMAEYLASEGYVHPAAVMTGSVLEEHLRQLAFRMGIALEQPDASGKAVPRKADVLNADLAKATTYNKLDQKQITAWLDLRNKAAHAKYAEYTAEQVVNMLRGVRDFLTRVPV